MLESCNTLWIGDRLGPVERACLRSALRAGHHVRLYYYGVVAGVPNGVECCDAAEIVPEDRIIRHRTGSVALFSDLFRYMLQRRKKGLWIDTDMYLLRPIDIDAPYVFGLQEPGLINGAVLKLPPDSPMLDRLLQVFEENVVPFWLSSEDRAAAEQRLRSTGRVGLSEVAWGAVGPAALSACAKLFDREHWTLGADVFYPVPTTKAFWIFDPSWSPEDFATTATRGFHLWNEIIKPWKTASPRPGSFLERLRDEGA